MLTVDQVRDALGEHAAGKSDDELLLVAGDADRLARALLCAWEAAHHPEIAAARTERLLRTVSERTLRRRRQLARERDERKRRSA